MSYVVGLACILIFHVNAEYTVKCNNNTNVKRTNSVGMEPSPDRVDGRYVILWCTASVANISDWEFYVNYNTARTPDQCQHYNVMHHRTFSPHSHFKENVNINLNCSHVCFSASIDLIFEACYHIKNQLYKQGHSMESYDQLMYITNNFPNITALAESKPVAKPLSNDDYVSVQWFMGPVPAVHFVVELNNITASEGGAEAVESRDVTENCTSAVHTVACRLRVPPGAYSLLFVYKEPWTYGSIAGDIAYVEFERRGAEAEPEVAGAAGAWAAAWWGAAGACGALALCGLAALLLRRARLLPPSTLHTADEAGAAEGAVGAAGGVRVLLLYARDCPALLAAARRLAALLQHAAPDRVYDLYSPAVSAQAARAPGEWLRALLGREDVRVVLLQTPAAACLYAAQLRQRGYTLALEQPLLGARVAPRRPHCADALLQLALRLMCEAALPHQHPYRKYYVAEISGLEANVVPLVTPQRRYVLPAATELLLRDLMASAPAAPVAPTAPADQLAQFTRALEELQQFVRDHPDYLNDELIFL